MIKVERLGFYPNGYPGVFKSHYIYEYRFIDKISLVYKPEWPVTYNLRICAFFIPN